MRSSRSKSTVGSLATLSRTSRTFAVSVLMTWPGGLARGSSMMAWVSWSMTIGAVAFMLTSEIDVDVRDGALGDREDDLRRGFVVDAAGRHDRHLDGAHDLGAVGAVVLASGSFIGEAL